MNNQNNRMKDSGRSDRLNRDLPGAMKFQVPGLSNSFSLVEFIPKEA